MGVIRSNWPLTMMYVFLVHFRWNRFVHVYILCLHSLCIFLSFSQILALTPFLEKNFKLFQTLSPFLWRFVSLRLRFFTRSNTSCKSLTRCCTFYTRPPRLEPLLRILSSSLTLSRFLPLTWFLEILFKLFHCCLILLHVLTLCSTSYTHPPRLRLLGARLTHVQHV